MADTLSDFEKAMSLKNELLDRATGQGGDNERYQQLRQELLKNPEVDRRLPDFVRTCRSIPQFWHFIKPKFGTYDERRDFLHSEFEPVLDYLEFDRSTPADDEIGETLHALNSDHVMNLWSKALERRDSDPAGAITVARSMLESVFKHVLDEVRGDHPEDANLNELYRETSEALDMHPMQYDEKVFKSILGSAHNIVDELGHFRNEASDAHGPGPYHLNPRPRHAQLAVNLAGAIADYVVRTWEAREDS